MMWKKEYKNRFNPSGRIGRKDFFKNVLFILISYFLLFRTLPFLMPALTQSGQIIVNIIFFLGFFYALFLVYTLFCLLAKRTHDIGFRLWWLCLVIIGARLIIGQLIISLNPLYSRHINYGITLIILLFLLFKKGQGKKNKFGGIV